MTTRVVPLLVAWTVGNRFLLEEMREGPVPDVVEEGRRHPRRGRAQSSPAARTAKRRESSAAV